jgi:hypothetical protein
VAGSIAFRLVARQKHHREHDGENSLHGSKEAKKVKRRDQDQDTAFKGMSSVIHFL